MSLGRRESQNLNRDEREGQADLQLRHTNCPGASSHHSVVTTRRQHTAACNCMSVDSSDQRFRKPELLRDHVHQNGDVFVDVIGSILQQADDVHTCGENRAGSGENNSAYLGRLLEFVELVT